MFQWMNFFLVQIVCINFFFDVKALHESFFDSTSLMFGSVYLQEFFLKGELLAGFFFFFFCSCFPLQDCFFWELSPPFP